MKFNMILVPVFLAHELEWETANKQIFQNMFL